MQATCAAPGRKTTVTRHGARADAQAKQISAAKSAKRLGIVEPLEPGFVEFVQVSSAKGYQASR